MTKIPLVIEITKIPLKAKNPLIPNQTHKQGNKHIYNHTY